MKRLKTLRVRFALWTAGLLLAALALFGLFVYVNMAHSLTVSVDETLRPVTVQISLDVESREGEIFLLEESIEDPEFDLLREQGLSLRIFDLAGTLIYAYGPYQDVPQPHLDATMLDDPGEYITITDPATRDSVRLFTSPIVQEGKVVGAIQVAQNLKNIRGTLNLLLMNLLIGGPMIVIMAGGLGYFLAARALAPIHEIIRMARNISADDLSARLNLPATDDEVGWLAATFDSMLARLDNAFRREHQFTADASHELRTPLAAMQAIIGSTIARQNTPADYEQALLDLGREADQMRGLTDDLLQLARTDSAQKAAKFESLDLAMLLKDVIDSLRSVAEEKGLQLVDQVPDAGLTLQGDSDALIRLFVNLIDNAIKYTVQGTITIATHPQAGNSVAVTICDTGVGIAHECLPYIFDRFYRTDPSRSSNGLGLGLAIAQEIAHHHGGSITGESEVGQGTTFTVQLSTM